MSAKISRAKRAHLMGCCDRIEYFAIHARVRRSLGDKTVPWFLFLPPSRDIYYEVMEWAASEIGKAFLGQTLTSARTYTFTHTAQAAGYLHNYAEPCGVEGCAGDGGRAGDQGAPKDGQGQRSRALGPVT